MYLKKIDHLSWKWLITILVWPRRIGKSTILKQYMKQVWEEQCLYIQKELHEFDSLIDYKDLYEYVKNHVGAKKYILIDEVQLIVWREKTINWLLAERWTQKDIIITWSNSDLLSTEISTLLRWRTFELVVYPFSFSEYCEYLAKEQVASSMQEYLLQWGMPSVYHLDVTQQQEWMEWLINTVFLKDIVARYTIRDVDLLKSVFMYLMNTVSDQMSLTNIKNYLVNAWFHINLNTLGNYVLYLQNSLLIKQVEMYDIQWKKILERTKKYYAADHAMRSYLFSWFDKWWGKIIENYVYISLCAAWYRVQIGKIRDKEVDFIAEKQWKKIYVQATYILSDEKVIEREFGSLLTITDQRTKYVVSADTVSLWIIKWVQHIQLHEREKTIAV